MADFPAEYLQVGRRKRATDFAAGRNTPITQVELGVGNRTPDGSETDLVTPFNPPLVIDNPGGAVFADTVQISVNLPASLRAPADLDIHEMIFRTTDGTAIFYTSTAAGPMVSKPGNAALIIPLHITFAGDNLTGFTFSNLPIPIGSEDVAGVLQLASNAETIAGTVATKPVPVTALHAWWNQLTFAASKLASGVLNVARIPNLPASKIISGVFPVGRIPDIPLSKVDPVQQAVADGGTIAWNFNTAEVATVTLGGNRTLAVPTGGEDNKLYLLRVTQDGTGGRTLALHNSIDLGERGAPTLSTAPNATDVLGFMKWGNTVHYMGILDGY